VTNSHCTSLWGGFDGGAFWQPCYPAAEVIGFEAVDPGFLTAGICPANRVCRYSDSAFVKLDNPADASLGFIARPNVDSTAWDGGPKFRIVDERRVPEVVGVRVTKVGRRSGRTEGEIKVVCANRSVTDTNITYLCQTDADFIAAAGDSGSPVFRIIHSPNLWDVKLYGILWGQAVGDFQPGSRFYSPISSIQGILTGDYPELGRLTKCASGFDC
jgi:hypothetical protein